MTGGTPWLWLPDLSNDEARHKVAQAYAQINRGHWIKACSREASPASQEVSEAAKDPLHLLSYLSVIFGLALGGRDSRQTEQGHQALQGLIQSQSNGHFVTSTIFFVAFVHAVSYQGSDSNVSAGSLESLETICDALMQDLAAARRNCRTSLTEPAYAATLGHLLVIMGAKSTPAKGWSGAVSTTAEILKGDGLDSQSCAVIATILDENLKAALGSHNASSESREGQSGEELFAKGPVSRASTIEADYKAHTTAAIQILAAATLTWSHKSTWIKTLLSSVGSDRSILLKHLITQLATSTEQSGHSIPRDVVFSVLPHIITDLDRESGDDELVRGLFKAMNEAKSPAQSSTSGVNKLSQELINSCRTLDPQTGNKESSKDELEHSGDDGSAFVLAIVESAGEQGIAASAFLKAEHLSDANQLATLFGILNQYHSARPALRWVGEAMQQSVRSLDGETPDVSALEPLAGACSQLLDQPELLSSLLRFVTAKELHKSFSDIFLDPSIFEHLDWPGSGGDEGPTHLKQIFLFMQTLEKLDQQSASWGEETPSADLRTLDENERSLLSRWISELFDSDGISDELIRDSPPCLLLKIAPVIFSQSVTASSMGVIDLDMVRNGLSSFLQDPVSYTLPRVVRWLISEIRAVTILRMDKRDQRQPESLQSMLPEATTRANTLVVVLHLILTDSACPRLVHQVAKEPFNRLLLDGVLSTVSGVNFHYEPQSYDVSLIAAIRDRLAEVSPVICGELEQMQSLSRQGLRAHLTFPPDAASKGLPSISQGPNLLDFSLVSGLERLGAFTPWSVSREAATHLRTTLRSFAQSQPAREQAVSASAYVAWLIAINLKAQRLPFRHVLVTLGLFCPMLDGEELELLFRVRVLAQVLRIAHHYQRACRQEEESEDVQQLVDCCLLQVISCVFPGPNDNLKTMDKTQTLVRRDLLRQALQILCERGNNSAAAAAQHLDGALSDEIIQRTTKLWDTMTT